MATALSILIPSRNEMFLARTIQSIIENSEAETEIIATMDGEWANPSVPIHDMVNLIYVPVSIGQRAATNIACKLAKGKYVMKVDAHCSFDKGFDRKMLEMFEKTGDNVTMAPTMRNLWAFDWKCMKCGKKWYQGPTPTQCQETDYKKTGKPCDGTVFKRKMMWVGKERPQSNSFCFDSEPHFQYMNEFTKRKGYEKGLIVGYNLSFDEPSLSASIISLLADLTNSHQFTSSANSLGFGENVSVDTMGLSSVDGSGGVRINQIIGIGNKSEVGGITTPSVLTNVVDDGNILSPTSGNGTNQPSISDSVCKGFLSEMGAPTITPLIYPPFPIPTSGSVINSDIIQKFNNIIGGEFVYNEKTSSFHNGSVALEPVYDKNLTESMSLQGSAFMLTREKYWELNISDEAVGSWGNQGLEVACKTWLSGGRVLINHNTWYAHMFRTQGGDFGFPYSQSGREVQRTKARVWEFFTNGKWDKQVHPVSWLVEKFMPVSGWNKEQIKKLSEK